MQITDIKKDNKRKILKLLYSKGTWSKSRVAKQLGLSPSVVTRLCGDLAEQNLIVANESISSHRAGRKEIEIEINAQFKKCIGISLSDKKTKLALTDLKLQIIDSSEMATDKDPAVSLKNLKKGIEQMIAKHDLRKEDVLGLGISVKGETNGVHSFNGVWENAVNVRDYLKAHFDLPIVMDNGVRCSAVYEQMFYGEPNFVLVKYIEAGIGAAVVRKNELLFGENHAIADFGHMIVDPTKDYCPICKRKGCLESQIDIRKLIQKVQESFSLEETPILWESCQKDPAQVTLAAIIAAADQGSIVINKIFKRNAELFAMALINAKALFDIDDFIIVSRLFESKKFKIYFQSAINDYQLLDMKGRVIIRHEEETFENQVMAVALLIERYLINELI